MMADGSIFLDITLPNAPTWFYFSALLAVALFFKFTRLLSMRNLDVVMMFVLVPGLLLVGGKHPSFWGYVWLLGASVYYLVRCLVDLALIRRPALSPNLNLSGLVWLAGALFVSLVAVTIRQPNEPVERGEKPNTPIGGAAESVLTQHAPADVVDRGLTLLCHLSIVVVLVLVGWRHFEDRHAGMAAATFYLLLPYTFLLVPSAELGMGRWDHAWPMALMVWAVLAYRLPTLAGGLLGVAAGSVFFPALTFPVWFSFYRRRGAGRFALAFVVAAGVCLAVLSGLLWRNGGLPRSLQSAWNLSDWQPWKPPRPEARGLWTASTEGRKAGTSRPVAEQPTAEQDQDRRDKPGGAQKKAGQPGHADHVPEENAGVNWVYRIPVFIAYVTFVLATAFWPAPKNLAHVLALSAAVLIGTQLWYGDRGGIYVLWYLPFLLLVIFRPNLAACQPAPPSGDLLARLGRKLVRALRRLLHLPEPAAPLG